MKYYIAHPAPINEIVSLLEKELNCVITVHPLNNQVGVFESNLNLEIVDSIIKGYDCIIINDTLDEWITT